jgi:hypothetical protein
MNQSLLLRDASMQDIQLELLRRTRFNDMDGEKVLASLMKHRNLWRAVLLDRPGVADHDSFEHLLVSGLIKLRDLAKNIWNADTLYILTPTPVEARELARIAEEQDWFGEVRVYEDKQYTDRALGMGRREYGLLSVWWD